MTRRIVNGLTLLLICAVSLAVAMNTAEPSSVLKLIRRVDKGFIALGIISLLVYIVLEALMIHLMLNHDSDKRYPWISALKATVIGQYFNLVTPFSSGGQPMQLHAMVKDGISLKQGTAVLVNKFLVFQIGVTVYSVVLVFLRWVVFHQGLPVTSALVYLGISVNCMGLAGITLSIFRPNALKGLVTIILHHLHRFRFIKRGVYWITWSHHKIDDYTAHIRDMMGMGHIVFPVVVLTWIQLTAYFSIGWFVYRAMGLSGSSYLSILTLQAILFTSVAFIPTPGSAGAAEGGFYLLFSAIFSPGKVGGGILLWRGISYYLNMVITGALTLVFTLKQIVYRQH